MHFSKMHFSKAGPSPRARGRAGCPRGIRAGDRRPRPPPWFRFGGRAEPWGKMTFFAAEVPVSKNLAEEARTIRSQERNRSVATGGIPLLQDFCPCQQPTVSPLSSLTDRLMMTICVSSFETFAPDGRQEQKAKTVPGQRAEIRNFIASPERN